MVHNSPTGCCFLFHNDTLLVQNTFSNTHKHVHKHPAVYPVRVKQVKIESTIISSSCGEYTNILFL